MLWSSLRSHWVFKFERLNHELIQLARSSNKNFLAKSLFRACLDRAHMNEQGRRSECTDIETLPSGTPQRPCQEKEVAERDSEYLREMYCIEHRLDPETEIKFKRFNQFWLNETRFRVGETVVVSIRERADFFGTIAGFVSCIAADRVVKHYVCFSSVYTHRSFDVAVGLPTLTKREPRRFPRFADVGAMSHKVLVFPSQTHYCSVYGLLPW
jgi:hypothetical protein